MAATQEQLNKVQLAIGALDKTAPAGWRSKIDLELLDMSSLSYCPLGQIFGSFWSGEAEPSLTAVESVGARDTLTSNAYRTAWRQLLTPALAGTWHPINPDEDNPVQVLSVFSDDDREFVVYKTAAGFKYIKAMLRFKELYQQEKPVPKYVKGGLYTPKTGGSTVLVFTYPGFIKLDRYSSWSASTEYFEREYGELVPVELVGLNVDEDKREKQAIVQL
jgi:hypothetical protein